jgi:hypothetical protein
MAPKRQLKIKKRKLVALVALLAVRFKLKRNSPVVWQKSWLKNRQSHSSYSLIQNELRLTDPMSFKTYLRMSPQVFEELLIKVAPKIAKQDTFFRQAISPGERLSVTLRFLVTGY